MYDDLQGRIRTGLCFHPPLSQSSGNGADIWRCLTKGNEDLSVCSKGCIGD
jgi:hypothetical protein